MRFNKSACAICTESCRTKAITIDGGIAIDEGKCTECMQCVSECPSGCFSIADEDFPALLYRLRKNQNSITHSVLGCKHARDTEAHERTSCLGFLSEEHIISLTGYLGKPITLNLTACSGCRNSFIVDTLKERIQSAQMKTSLDVGKRIILAENNEELVFEDVSLDRRGFFQALKTMGFTQVAGLDKAEVEIPASYTAKRLPLKRDLLNTVVKKLSAGNVAAGILHNYAFTVNAGSSCTHCFACIGMCPTGALKIKKDVEGPGLLFNPSLCTGCGLCCDFCPAEAVSVYPGYFGNSYFEHDRCTVEAFTEHAVAGKQ